MSLSNDLRYWADAMYTEDISSLSIVRTHMIGAADALDRLSEEVRMMVPLLDTMAACSICSNKKDHCDANNCDDCKLECPCKTCDIFNSNFKYDIK